jgi:hypothetical protein
LIARVQKVFHERLKQFGFVNAHFHPQRLQSFSSDVINENGSWKQSSRWHFLQQIKFAMDASVVPFMIRINDTPSVLEAVGTYVATTTRQNGEPVYVQISLIELAKIKDPAQF